MNIEAIGFDLDGTLWDSSKTVALAWAKAVSDFEDVTNPPTEADLKNCMGLTLDQIGNKLFGYTSTQRQMEIMKKCCQVEDEYIVKKGGILYDKIEETLSTLQNTYKLFIVSNCQSGYIEAFLRFYDFKKYFCDIECAGNTGLEKSENIKLVLKRNNISNKKAVYVGDTDMDWKAAQKADVAFIHAKYGFGKPDQNTPYVLSPDQIPNILNTL